MKCNTLSQGNVGDSRAIASVSGRVEELSFDHKPSNELETKRIVAAGGWVEFNRVNGEHGFACSCEEISLTYILSQKILMEQRVACNIWKVAATYHSCS